MKNCPQCHQDCDDDMIICPNCGYLFNAAGPNDGSWDQHAPYSNAPGQPPYGNGYYETPKSGMATASMVLGIVGIILSFGLIGVIPDIVGLILGIISLVDIQKNGKRGFGQALAGVILSGLGIIIAVIIIILAVAVFQSPMFTSEMQRAMEQYQSQSQSY